MHLNGIATTYVAMLINYLVANYTVQTGMR